MKILILVVLMIGSSQAFAFSRERDNPGVTNFFAFTTVGLLIAIFAVALSRDRTRRR